MVVIAVITYITNKMNPFHKVPARAKVEKEWEERISGERYSSRAEYYANYFGYECEDIDVETEDGFVLRMHHLTSKKHKTRKYYFHFTEIAIMESKSQKLIDTLFF